MLKDLIILKSQRDGVNFTVNQLAKAINMPHSILVKLLHPDPTKRVNNPRIDTLIKIIEFFKSDGFLVTIDDFIFGQKEIDIQNQLIENDSIERIIPTFSLNYELTKIGFVNVKLPRNHNDLIALLSDEDIKPFFKAGSIFIVNKTLKPENDNLVAIKIENHKKIFIRKLILEKGKKILMDLNNSKNSIQLLPTMHYLILGVVIQVNAIT